MERFVDLLAAPQLKVPLPFRVFWGEDVWYNSIVPLTHCLLLVPSMFELGNVPKFFSYPASVHRPPLCAVCVWVCVWGGGGGSLAPKVHGAEGTKAVCPSVTMKL